MSKSCGVCCVCGTTHSRQPTVTSLGRSQSGRQSSSMMTTGSTVRGSTMQNIGTVAVANESCMCEEVDMSPIFCGCDPVPGGLDEPLKPCTCANAPPGSYGGNKFNYGASNSRKSALRNSIRGRSSNVFGASNVAFQSKTGGSTIEPQLTSQSNKFTSSTSIKRNGLDCVPLPMCVDECTEDCRYMAASKMDRGTNSDPFDGPESATKIGPSQRANSIRIHVEQQDQWAEPVRDDDEEIIYSSSGSHLRMGSTRPDSRTTIVEDRRMASATDDVPSLALTGSSPGRLLVGNSAAFSSMVPRLCPAFTRSGTCDVEIMVAPIKSDKEISVIDSQTRLYRSCVSNTCPQSFSPYSGEIPERLQVCEPTCVGDRCQDKIKKKRRWCFKK